MVKEPEEKEFSVAVRRACKLVATEREGRKIHVYTKGVDWSRVFDKTKSGNGVTDSELRAIARDEIRNGINPNILFYASDGILMNRRPWDLPEVNSHFKQYKKHILERDEAGLSNRMKG